MRYRRLGDTGPVVSALGYGCLALGDAGPEAGDAVRRAIDLGVTLFDTADYYGQGRAETELGRALGARRDEVVIATKTGIVHREGGPPGVDGRPARIRSACERSLRRLGTERLDLYLLARVDPAVPVEESVGAMADLVAAGKVAHIGLCEAAPSTLKRAHAAHPLAALQTEYSLWERHVEDRIRPACAELGIGFIAYRPLGLGMLTGDAADIAALPPADWRRRDPRFQDANLHRNRRLADLLREPAADKGVTPGQLALAWLLDRGVVPIPGMLRPEHVRENVAAVDLSLTAADRARLDAVFTPGAAAGQRYPPPLLAMVDRDRPRPPSNRSLATFERPPASS
jgi:aryl-alcohol dehydrogenase-like predicted oxidoreductase